MEKTSSTRSLHQCFSLVEAVVYIVLDSILLCVCRLRKLLRTSSLHFKKAAPICDSEAKTELIKTEDVEYVMERMGMSLSRGGGKLELSNVFEEEPSLEDAKEAFRVFDANSDGFIEAAELQRVLSSLGFLEGADFEACRLMISAHDQDLDGRIDFNEFVTFMESSLC